MKGCVMNKNECCAASLKNSPRAAKNYSFKKYESKPKGMQNQVCPSLFESHRVLILSFFSLHTGTNQVQNGRKFVEFQGIPIKTKLNENCFGHVRDA